MSNDALRQEALHDGTSARDVTTELAAVAALKGSRPSVWTADAERLELVLDAAGVDALVAEGARWAERITACVTAPQSQHGASPLWGELLARGTKCERILVRRADQAEPWLLHRLHDTGALLLVEGGGKQVASNLLMFARGDELRVVLSHIPLERALAGAAFGTLLCFRGAPDAALARACQTQAESWAAHARFATGSEVDALTLDPRRREPSPVFAPGSLRALTEPGALSAGVERLQAALAAASGELSSLRAVPGGYRLAIEPRDRSRVPLVLSLYADAGWAAGNALLLQAQDGSLVLAWRGGLLGHGRPRAELMWHEARLPRFRVDSAELGALELGLVAHTSAPLAPQLAAFAAEISRLGRVFGVEPPPALAHVLSDFSTLSARQQALLLHRALIGVGALDTALATATATSVLRDQGYLRGPRPEPGGALFEAIAASLDEAATAGQGFDRPRDGALRAIAPDASAYEPDDWRECLLCALPEDTVVPRRAAVRLAFEHARERRGLAEPRLRAGGAVARALESALSSALRRGLLVRVGAAGVARLTRAAPPELLPVLAGAGEAGVVGVLEGFRRALGRLSPLGRAILTRRAGLYGRREALEDIAQRLGLPPERARQLEADAWREVATDAAWVRALGARLTRALSGARVVEVSALVADDAFWLGIERHLGLAEALFESLLGGEARHVTLGVGPRRRDFFARFSQAELDEVWSELWSALAAVSLPAPLPVCLAACAAACERLDAALAEPLREALEPQLVLDPADPARVLSLTPAPAELEASPLGEGGAPLSEALLRLEDVLRSIFRSAGTPLSLDALTERVSKRLDAVPADTLVQRLSRAPFVRRNPDQYGTLARDVPGGPEAIAAALNEVTEALASAERALPPEALLERVRARVGQVWSPELVYSLIESDPVLELSPARVVTLRRWEHAERLDPGRACPSVPSGARARFDELSSSARPAPELRRRLADELRRLERAGELDDFVSLPLARQLVDLHERLLDEAPLLPGAEPLAAASASFFLDAIAPDEDDESGDTVGVDRERVLEARAVASAVLRWLGLGWLEPGR